jgi:hypothetical protein
MIFSNKARQILNEWLLDFQNVPLGKLPFGQDEAISIINSVVPAFKKAVAKKDCNTTFVGVIAERALQNMNEIQLLEIKNEAKIIIKEIKQYYDVEYDGTLMKMTKKTK